MDLIKLHISSLFMWMLFLQHISIYLYELFEA